MKITLDNKALERLIGGNTEAEIELRNCIVQEFTNKHLKGLVNHELIEQLNEKIFDIIKEELKNQVGVITSTGWMKSKFTIAKTLEDEIRKVVRESIDPILS